MGQKHEHSYLISVYTKTYEFEQEIVEHGRYSVNHDLVTEQFITFTSEQCESVSCVHSSCIVKSCQLSHMSQISLKLLELSAL